MVRSLGHPAGYLTDTLEPLVRAASQDGFALLERASVDGRLHRDDVAASLTGDGPVSIEQVDADLTVLVAAAAVPGRAREAEEIVGRYTLVRDPDVAGDPVLAVQLLVSQALPVRHLAGLAAWADEVAATATVATYADRDALLDRIKADDAAPQVAALGPRPTRAGRRQRLWDARHREVFRLTTKDQLARAQRQLPGEDQRVVTVRKLHMAASLVRWIDHRPTRYLRPDGIDGPTAGHLETHRRPLPPGGGHLSPVSGQMTHVRDPWLAAHAPQPIFEANYAAWVIAQQVRRELQQQPYRWQPAIELVEGVLQRGRIAAGARSEVRVAETLADDERLGWVVHEVQLAGGDADHVVVGPGVTVVETKTGRGPGEFVRDGTSVNVAVGGKPLKAEGGSVVSQARRQAGLVGDVLAEVGHTDVDVRIVVCVTDMSNGPLTLGDVTVCSVEDLADVVASDPTGEFDQRQAEQVARLLAAG